MHIHTHTYEACTGLNDLCHVSLHPGSDTTAFAPLPTRLSSHFVGCLQAGELLFGAAGRPHDYLQEALFRLVGVGLLGISTQNWVLKVG